MKEYKRLTEKHEHPLTMSMWGESVKTLMCYNRLAELEDKIENGTLIELPCKDGEMLYEVRKKPRPKSCVKEKKGFFIMEHLVLDVKFNMYWGKPFFEINTLNKDIGVSSYSAEVIGETVFLTKAEAEAKLKEQQNDARRT